MSTKERVLEMIQNLPDDVSYDDIEYHVYAQKRVERSREAGARGESISHEEVVEQVRKWRNNFDNPAEQAS